MLLEMYEDHGKKMKITVFTHLVSLLSLMFMLTLGVLFVVWTNFDSDAILIMGIFFLIDAIPSLYLHYEYWTTNRAEEVVLRSSEILIRKNGNDIIVKSEEIKKITIYLSPALYKNSNFHLLAIEAYHYAKINLKSGEEIILTSLLNPKLHRDLKQVKGVLFERRKTLFCQLGLFNKWLSS